MKRIRAMECACGHIIRVEAEENSKVKLGDKLFIGVQDHVDKVHPDLNLSNKEIWIMLAEKAYTPPESTK